MSLEIEVSVPAPPTINVTVEPGGAQGPPGADSTVPGPSAVSADDGNIAVLGTDDLIFVPASGGGGAVDSVNGQTGVVVLDATDVGLGNVDNTADADKPVSTATATALSGKADTSHSHAESDVTGLTAALAAKADASAVTTALAGKSDTGHTHVESDVTGLSAALAAKAPLASPAFTGTPTGITKSHVGLGNVDNTSDTAKPVSTAQQTALDLKANLASPALTGNPTAPTASVGDNDTSIATTAFVAAAIDVAGSANNPHTTEGAARNSSLTKNFWQYTGTAGVNDPDNWIAGDEWISA